MESIYQTLTERFPDHSCAFLNDQVEIDIGIKTIIIEKYGDYYSVNKCLIPTPSAVVTKISNWIKNYQYF